MTSCREIGLAKRPNWFPEGNIVRGFPSTLRLCQSLFAPSINSASHSQAAMMRYSLLLLTIRNRSRNPRHFFNYMLICFPYFDGHVQHGRERTWKAKPSKTQETGVLVLSCTLRHSQAIPSLPSCAVLYPHRK